MSQSLHIIWKPENETGIPILDEQHRGIVSIINSFGFSMQHGEQSEFYLNTIFTMMDCYTKIHFSTEEELFRLSCYPDAENHKKLHLALINKSFSVASKSMRLRDPQIYLAFLKDWWVSHIVKEDCKYMECLKNYLAD